MSVLSRIKPMEAPVSAYVDLPETIPGKIIQSSRGPLTQIQKPVSYVPTTTLVTDDDIDKLGVEVTKNVGPTTEKIISKMSVGKFDELGAILTQIQVEAGKLDPASLKKSGLAGWWMKHFGDMKQQLTMKLKTAEDVFDKLEEKISQHMAVHAEWVKDLETLYQENYAQYQQIQEIIKKSKVWEESMDLQLKNWPEVAADDPEAMMKVQAKRDAEAILNRLRRKADSFVRLRVITESNAPKIRSQQETSRTTISTLRDIVEQTIPLIKTEFSLFIQSLDAQKSIQLVDSAKDLANKTLTKSADAAKQSAIDSAKSFNNPVVLTETLNHIRSKMIETVQEVGRIEREAAATRASDAKMLEESQKQYLMQLQQNGALYAK